LSYTKTKQYITRVDFEELCNILFKWKGKGQATIERPMVNPGRFKTTMSAMRSLEALLIALEMVQIPYLYIDSKEWQKALLPSGLKGDELKKASMDIGIRLFPGCKDEIKKQGDADAMLIAYYKTQQRKEQDAY